MEELRGEVKKLTLRLEILEKEKDRTEVMKQAFNPKLDIEKRIVACQEQYSGRETVEIVGLPGHLHGTDLEELIIDVFNTTDVDVSRRSFHAIHHITNGVIAKLTNRRDEIQILINKKRLCTGLSKEEKEKLKSNKIYINESLCPCFRKLHGQCNRILKFQNDKSFILTSEAPKLANFYVVNGKIIVKYREGERRQEESSKWIQHEDDLKNIFGKEFIESLFTQF